MLFTVTFLRKFSHRCTPQKPAYGALEGCHCYIGRSPQQNKSNLEPRLELSHERGLSRFGTATSFTTSTLTLTRLGLRRRQV